MLIDGLLNGILGTTVVVTVTNQFLNPTGIDAQCTLDDESLPIVFTTLPQNSVTLCGQNFLADEPHTLVVNVSVTNQEIFWLDFVGYTPSLSAVSQTQTSESVGFLDQDLQNGMDSEWEGQEIFPGIWTSQMGSSVNFSFTGKQYLQGRAKY